MIKDDQNISLLTQLKNFAGGPLLSVLINLFTVPVITRLISPEELGKASVFTMIQMGFYVILLLGLDQAFVRYYNDRKYTKKEILFTSIIFPLLLCLFAIFILIFFRKDVSFWLFSQHEPFVIILLCFYLPLLIINRFSFLVIRMELRGVLFSVLGIVEKLTNFSGMVLLLFFFERTFRSVVFASFLSLAMSTAVSVFFTRFSWSFDIKYFNKLLAKDLFRFGLPLIPATAVTWIFNSFDKFGLKQWSSYEEIGIYEAAFKVASSLTVFQTIFTTAWIPVAYKWYELNVDTKRFENVNAYVLAFMSFIFCGVVVFRDIIVLFLGPSYRNISGIFMYLLFVPFTYTISYTTTVGIDLKKKTIFNLIAITVCTVANIIGNFILIPMMGAKGAAISTALSCIMFFWIRTIFSRKLWYNFPVRNHIVVMFMLLVFIQIVDFGMPRYFEIITVIFILFVNFFMIRSRIRSFSKHWFFINGQIFL
jgi:O-antigen/teichoic acid export membrane protein